MRPPRVIEGRRQFFRAAAIALVHPDHIHARRQALLGNAQHVLRVAGALEAMQGDQGQCILSVCLPMAVAQHLYSRFHFNQAFFRNRNTDSPLQEEAGNGLAVSAP